jgi:hypothetical protein
MIPPDYSHLGRARHTEQLDDCPGVRPHAHEGDAARGVSWIGGMAFSSRQYIECACGTREL